MREYFVYILSNTAHVLYIGVTGNLESRFWEHTQDRTSIFTARYNLDRLVYYESYPTPRDAIAREKQLKGWRRSKKIALIESRNPRWTDLSDTFTPEVNPPTSASPATNKSSSPQSSHAAASPPSSDTSRPSPTGDETAMTAAHHPTSSR